MRPVLIFLLGVPMGVSLIYGLVGAGTFARYFPIPVAVLYWIGFLVPKWLVQYGCTWLLDRILRPRSLTVLLVLGGALGGLLIQPYGTFYLASMQERLAHYIPEDERREIRVVLPTSPQRIIGTGPQHLVSITVWTVAGLISVPLLGFPRFQAGGRGHGRPPVRATGETAEAGAEPPMDEASEVAGSPELPELASRLSRVPIDGIVAASAEDHYVRFYSASESELVHYRISDAAEELSRVLPGMRIHRSHWIAMGAVAEVVTSGTSHQVRLTNGLVLPVGRSYLEAARLAGVIPA